MTLHASTANRLSKLIPRLATDHNGEIAAGLRQHPSASLSPKQTEVLDGLLRRAWEDEQ